MTVKSLLEFAKGAIERGTLSEESELVVHIARSRRPLKAEVFGISSSMGDGLTFMVRDPKPRKLRVV